MSHAERKRNDSLEVRPAGRSASWSPAVRRSYPRFSVDCPVSLQPDGSDTTFEGTAVNVSRGGALIRTAERLDEARRHLVAFLPEENGHAFAGHACPNCGHVFGVRQLRRMSVWARVLRQGGGGHDTWAAAVEFERLIDLGEDEPGRDTP